MTNYSFLLVMFHRTLMWPYVAQRVYGELHEICGLDNFLSCIRQLCHNVLQETKSLSSHAGD